MNEEARNSLPQDRIGEGVRFAVGRWPAENEAVMLAIGTQALCIKGKDNMGDGNNGRHLPSRSDSDASRVQSRLRWTPLPLVVVPWSLSRVVPCAFGDTSCGMYSYHELEDRVALAESRIKGNGEVSTRRRVLAVTCLMSVSKGPSLGRLVMVSC